MTPKHQPPIKTNNKETSRIQDVKLTCWWALESPCTPSFLPQQASGWGYPLLRPLVPPTWKRRVKMSNSKTDTWPLQVISTVERKAWAMGPEVTRWQVAKSDWNSAQDTTHLGGHNGGLRS